MSNKNPKGVFSEVRRFFCSKVTLIRSLFRANSDYKVSQSLDKHFVGILFEMTFSQMLWGAKRVDINQH